MSDNEASGERNVVRRKPDDERCDDRFHFRLPRAEKEAFLEACFSENVNHVKLLRSWMQRYVDAYHPTLGKSEGEEE